MASKTKSKAKKSTSGIFTAIALLFGIASLIMIFLPAIKVVDTDTAYTGLQVIFGYEEVNETLLGTLSIPKLEFSFMNLLTYILVIVGVVLLVLNIIGKGNSLTSLISIVAFIVAGILFFLTVGFTMPAISDTASNLGVTAESIREHYALGVGAILGGIFSIIAGASQLVKNFVK